MKIKKYMALALSISIMVLTACGQNSSENQADATVNESVPENVQAQMENDIPVNIIEEVIDVPEIENERIIYLVSDSHISMCDERDADVMEKAIQRAGSFATDGIQAQDRFDAIISKASETNNEMIIFGGDIIDSAMHASIDHIKEQFGRLDSEYLYLMGNHDFEYGTEYFSPAAYEQYLPRLEDVRGDAAYQVKEYDDIIYFAADDDNSQIDQEILDAFKDEVQKGKPIVLSVHVPIEPITGDMSLVEMCKEVWGPSADGKSRVTMGINGCYPSPVTKEFIDLVTADDSPVVLVLAGHIHFYHKDMLNDKVVQIVSGAAFEGDAVKIILK